MTPKQELAFVKRHGVALQAARGSVTSLAEEIAAGPIHGMVGASRGPRDLRPRGRDL